MAVLTKEQLMEDVRTHIGDDTSDSALALIENINDTVNDLETRANGDGTDWKKKYEDNDKEWRKKYTDRFFSNEPENVPDPDPEDPPEEHTPMNFEDLFTEIKED